MKNVRALLGLATVVFASQLFYAPQVADQKDSVLTPNKPILLSTNLVEYRVTPESPLIVSQNKKTHRNAIVYLAQRRRHSSYGRDSFPLFLKSLKLLHDNFLKYHSDDIDLYVFHSGDFAAEDYAILQAKIGGLPIIKLVDLSNTSYWTLPAFLENDRREKWIDANKFSVGYRHMVQFFAIRIWEFFKDYDYIWRLDEDSFIYSPIKYNLFQFMRNNSYQYGYRMCTYELQYIYNEWNKHRRHASLPPESIHRPFGKKMCAFYNNFFVAKVDLFRSQKARAWLSFCHEQAYPYRRRIGDLLIHSAAVYAFASPDSIHRFLDFTYQHLTLENGCPEFGGLQAGYLDHEADLRIQELEARFPNCSHTQGVTTLRSEDLSPTYNHLNGKNVNLKGFYARNDRCFVEASEGKGVVSG